ncbi:MAG: ABC transporter permease [Limnochordia bacterium]|jgi:putative ABC transport system permease protein|nr:ABC transporter permease [Bacillota bacterium]NLH30506.1 FtsX-like permease family protein [Bacillota bacterium]HPT92814.1 ABC transporter permease [Limnochordia bacterium]HXK97411.1 ABC transporter permease [Limnochordia bacterium]
MNSFVFTIRLIKKRPLRSLLTILQIALGVWIVATILTMNLQALDRIDAVFNRFGENLVQISLQPEIDPSGVVRSIGGLGLQPEDLLRLRQESTNIESVFRIQPAFNSRIKAHGLTYELWGLTEISHEAISALQLRIVEGHGFTAQDEEQKNPVALVSTDLAQQLFPGESAVGKAVEMQVMFTDQFVPFEIIGVYEPLDPLLQVFFQQMTMLIPLDSRSGTGLLGPTVRSLNSSFYIKARPGKAHDAVADAREILKRENTTVSAEYFSEIGRIFAQSVTRMFMILGAFAFVAIVISSLGILSIMLVNVVERTREIGLRKALGATRSSIVVQVLNESIIFSLFGSVIGIAAAAFSTPYIVDGLLKSFYLQNMTDLGKFHPLAAVYSVGLALILGAFFGLYPAVSAARLTAVEALREA